MAARLAERVSFPVDILTNSSHEDLKSSAEKYLSNLRLASPNCPEFLSLPVHGEVPIRLSTVGFVPVYGEELTHKVLALFAPEDSITAVALYLADKWWSIDDIVRTSVSAREGLHQVKSVGERIVLYVLNRIIYRTQEMERNEIPFLCHRSNEYAKIMWKEGEAIGFYSVKPTGSICSSYCGKNYKLPVLDTAFVRPRHRERDSGLIILEDFVNSFSEKYLGLRYPLSSFMYTACKQYLEKYPRKANLLYEVSGPGYWFQRKCVATIVKREKLRFAAEASQTKKRSQQRVRFMEPVTVSEAGGQETERETQLRAESQKGEESTDVHASTSEDTNTAPASIWTRSSHLKRPRIGKVRQESGTSQGTKENAVVSESRLEPPARTSERSEGSVEVPEENTVEKNEEKTGENEGQPLSEAELHLSNPEKRSEEEENVSEPLNGEVTEEANNTFVVEKETANEVQNSESKLQSKSQAEPLILFVPLILESAAKPSEDTISEKGTTAGDSEALTEENTLKKDTEEQEEPEKAATENAAASASKEETSDSGLPNSTVTEAEEESVSENVSPKTASSLEDQNEEAGHNSQEAPVALSQSSLIMVELDGVSFQQPSGQEAQKNQLEEQSEEAVEQMHHQCTQTEAEPAADSSSDEAEIEVPVVDRRSLRRKVKSYKGPPKKKGKPL